MLLVGGFTMSILATLHQDHINMSKLLDLLEKNVEQIVSGERPDLRLMAEAIEYIGYYADLYHHPLEDILYEHFTNRDKALDQLLYSCRKEHRDLASCSQSALAPITLTLMDGMLPMEQIIKVLEKFLKAERDHLNFEEGQVFPMIKALANDEDWKMLRKRCDSGLKSELGEFDMKQYRSLYAELSNVQCV